MGVMGWDLYATLQMQAEIQESYRTQPPRLCPNDATPLQGGPPGSEDILFCPFDGWSYPRDWDPDLHSGMLPARTGPCTTTEQSADPAGMATAW